MSSSVGPFRLRGKCIRHNHAPDRAADPANWRTSCLSASPMRDASRKDADSCSNATPGIFETAAAGISRGLKRRSPCAPARKIFSAGLPPHTPPGMNSHLSTVVHTWKTHRIWATCLGDPGTLADAHDVGRDPPCGGLHMNMTHYSPQWWGSFALDAMPCHSHTARGTGPPQSHKRGEGRRRMWAASP